jgi:hypothetical protein
MYDATNPLQNDKDKIVYARSDEANIIFRCKVNRPQSHITFRLLALKIFKLFGFVYERTR